MKFFSSTHIAIIMFLALGVTSIGVDVFAQGQQESQFGDFEVLDQLPAFQGGKASIDAFVKQDNPAVRFIGAIVTFITAGIIVISLIAIMVAGYIYMTAGGDATKVSRAKAIIVSALLGIVLALAAVLILRTINPDLVPTQDPF